MKLILLFVWLLASNIMTGQESEKKAVQKTIETFFDGFHKQDSILIKQTVSENIIVQTIGKNKEGNSIIRNEDFGKFLKSIASIPDTLQFKEKLMSFNIQVDRAMANAWMPYELWMNNTFHHCGVNYFQLFKDENAWKIIYLIDTRRKEDCQE